MILKTKSVCFNLNSTTCNIINVSSKVLYKKIIMMLTENVCSKYQLSLQLEHNFKSD